MNRGAITYRKLQTPKGDGEILLDPPVKQSGELLRSNQQRLLAFAEVLIAGVRFDDLQTAARRELKDAAIRHTQTYQSVDAESIHAVETIALTGHQPTLFHPGVWFKSFCLAAITRQVQALGIHLIMDQDLATPSTVQCPSGTPALPALENIEFDIHAPDIVIEDYRLQDNRLFESFPDRMKTKLGGWIDHSVLYSFWSLAVEAETDLVGLKFAQARHQLEKQMGLDHLDVPWSHICCTSSFARFAFHLMQHAERFRKIYNEAVVEYRQVHQLRSQSHPVPELKQLGNRFELPLWIWSSASPQRQRMYCTVTEKQIRISDHLESFDRVLELDQGPDACVQQIQHWLAEGLRIRSRALITTMYSRLLLGDLFIHGIGGGKYDQVTDLIIQRFFGSLPPDVSIATATLQLPIPAPDDPSDKIDTIKTDLRNIQFSPEKYIRKQQPTNGHRDNSVDVLIAQKQELIDQHGFMECKHEWHQRVQAINHQLRQTIPNVPSQLVEQLQQLKIIKNNRLLLTSRDFPFILFPQKTFTTLLETVLNTP
ncbi:MAG: hypothetical protein NZ807_01045 [Dehalococcoidia bacterium]|nr:hypothetical protein [Dehalococcoidia bacterium]